MTMADNQGQSETMLDTVARLEAELNASRKRLSQSTRPTRDGAAHTKRPTRTDAGSRTKSRA
jgi:hypothetical protein